VSVAGADLTIEGSVVRGTLPQASDDAFGRGLSAQQYPGGGRSLVVVRGSVFDANSDLGLHVSSSDLTLEDTVVRGTQPQQSDHSGGRGVNVQSEAPPGGAATAQVHGCVIEDNREVGLFVAGSELELRGSIVRRTASQLSDGLLGRGLDIQYDPDTAAPSTATVSASVVQDNQDVGLFVAGSTAAISGTAALGTKARSADGLFGDDVVIVSEQNPASATLSANRLEQGARAGLANFGADVAVGASQISCHAFDLAGEPFDGLAFVFHDAGGKRLRLPWAE
jgi:hypothetical protein